jgi:RHS repeat-associated protein
MLAQTDGEGRISALIGQSEPLGTAGTTDLTITNAYDAIGRLTTKTTATLTGTVAGPTIDSQSYTYNASGAELSATDTLAGNPMSANGTSSYSYDALGRLTSAKVPTQSNQPNQAYTWNATADRATVQSGSSQPVTTYYNSASQPISDSTGGSYASDKEGRLKAQPGQSLKWDNLGRLTEVDGPGSSVTTYAYDPLDRLAAVVNGGVTTKYFYVGLTTTIAETIISTGSTTSTTRHLTDAAGTELAQVTGTSGPVYLGRNGHGDVTSTVNAAGSVVSAAQYDPFGKLTSSSGTLPANRWQGSLFEPNSGLYYVIARWYSPTLGRFLSVDPMSGNTARPQSLDRYAYVAGNPLGGVDPMGTCDWDTGSMTCKDSSGVDQSNFQSNLATATTVPFNKCLATNFHADGCTAGSSSGTVEVLGTYVETTSGSSSASSDLVAASDIIRAQVADQKAVADAEVALDAGAKKVADSPNLADVKVQAERIFDQPSATPSAQPGPSASVPASPSPQPESAPPDYAAMASTLGNLGGTTADILWRFIDGFMKSPESLKWVAQHGLAIDQVADFFNAAKGTAKTVQVLGWILNFADVIGGTGQCVTGTPWCDVPGIKRNLAYDTWDLAVGFVATSACGEIGPFAPLCGLAAAYALDPRNWGHATGAVPYAQCTTPYWKNHQVPGPIPPPNC